MSRSFNRMSNTYFLILRNKRFTDLTPQYLTTIYKIFLIYKLIKFTIDSGRLSTPLHPLWPGAYGSHETTSHNSDEDKGYKSFQKTKTTNPRYASLVDYDIKNGYSRYGFRVDDSIVPPNGIFSNYVGALDQHYLTATYHYILSRMGIDLDAHAMTFTDKTYAFATFGSGIDTLSFSILNHIRMGNDPDFKFLKTFLPDQSEGTDTKKMKYARGSSQHQNICEQLKKLSQAALSTSIGKAKQSKPKKYPDSQISEQRDQKVVLETVPINQGNTP